MIATTDLSPAAAGRTTYLDLQLHIEDPELCAQLAVHPEGRERHEFGITSMRIGALAMRHVQGHVDGESIRTEGQRLMESLERSLGQHSATMQNRLTSSLADYFDPKDGRFQERVERLIRKDGDLENVLRQHLGEDGSLLAQTLDQYVGEGSPLLDLLDPEGANGLLAGVKKAFEQTAEGQREAMAREFSLDNSDGALSRLVTEISSLQRKSGEDLEKVTLALAKEFSLDRKDSALSRLVTRVEQSQASLEREFSLDQEDSALARLLREVTQQLSEHQVSNSKFQAEVRDALTAMTARREEAKRSTRHGTEYEDEIFQLVQDFSQKKGDIATSTGNTVGLISRCKIGDVVVELGPEHAAAGAKIVLEAKGNASYNLKSALDEIREARENRGADVGIFVFAPHAAPEGLEPLERYGSDVVAVWDADDPTTDVWLRAALQIARALSAKAHAQREEREVDFSVIDRAILAVKRQAEALDVVESSCKKAVKNNEAALKATGKIREGLNSQVEVLEDCVDDLKVSLQGRSDG
jgi:hypothetical protein